MRRLLPLRVLHYDVQQAVISLLCRSFVTTELVYLSGMENRLGRGACWTSTSGKNGSLL